MSNNFVPQALRAAAEIYEQRNAMYGDNYKKFGTWAQPLLADCNATTVTDVNRLGVLLQMLSKMSRYVENFNAGGHDDSLDDLVVYSMMLKELDSERLESDLAAVPPAPSPIVPGHPDYRAATPCQPMAFKKPPVG